MLYLNRSLSQKQYREIENLQRLSSSVIMCLQLSNSSTFHVLVLSQSFVT